MPLYNLERYLAQGIESVLAQTEERFELILVDDKSPDRSLEIARAFAAKDPRIRILEREKNGGAAEAFDTGTRAARGKYVARIAADDIYYPTALAVMAQALDENPDAVVAYCNMVQIDEQSNVLYPIATNPPDTCLFPCNRTGLCFMWRQEVFRQVGGFSSGCYAEDYDFLLRASLKGPFVKVEGAPQMGFRLHGTQASSSAKRLTLGGIEAHMRYWRTVIASRPFSVFAWSKLAKSALRHFMARRGIQPV